jgi:hypothetical protein
MPRGDGTGPVGMGPMTGRAAGYCAGYGMPGYMNPGYGRGFQGWGIGYGGYPPYAQYAPYAPWGYPANVPYGPRMRWGFYRGRGFGRGRGRGRWW